MANASLNAAAAVPLLRAGDSDVLAELERVSSRYDSTATVWPSATPLLNALFEDATTTAQVYLSAHPEIPTTCSAQVGVENFIIVRPGFTLTALRQAQDLCPAATVAMITKEIRFVRTGERDGSNKTFYHLAFDLGNAVRDPALIKAMLMRSRYLHAVDAHRTIIAATEDGQAKAKLLLLPLIMLAGTIPGGDALSSSWMPLKYLLPIIPFILFIGYLILTRNEVAHTHPDFERERQADALTLAALPTQEQELFRDFLRDQLTQTAHVHAAHPHRPFLDQRIAALGPVRKRPAYAPPATGASAHTAGITIVVVPAATSGESEDSGSVRCVICQDAEDPSAPYYRLACRHEFHQTCIDAWIAHKSPPTCPLCIRAIPLT